MALSSFIIDKTCTSPPMAPPVSGTMTMSKAGSMVTSRCLGHGIVPETLPSTGKSS